MFRENRREEIWERFSMGKKQFWRLVHGTDDNSQKYIVYYLDKSYSNCSYHFKDRDAKTVEVVITNFKSEDYAHLII